MVLTPLDARYSSIEDLRPREDMCMAHHVLHPLYRYIRSAGRSSRDGQTPSIKALVLPSTPGGYDPSHLQVSCLVTCSKDRSIRRPLLRIPMQLETSHKENWGGRQASLFAATLKAGLECDNRIWVQVEATDKGDLQLKEKSDLPESRGWALLGASEVRPTSRSWWEPSREGGSSQKREEPMPLESSALE